MAEKKTVKKENSQVDLEEILGDIKTVVSGEKETLFKVSDYKTIKLKKENLINSGKKSNSPAVANHNNKELEELVKKIVRSELKNLQFLEKSPKPKSEKVKTIDKEIILRERANANDSILPRNIEKGVLVMSLLPPG